jgi:hypothetical protein
MVAQGAEVQGVMMGHPLQVDLAFQVWVITVERHHPVVELVGAELEL